MAQPQHLLLTQSKYAREFLLQTGMDNSKPIATLMVSNCLLSAYVGDPYDNPSHYRSIVGALRYLIIPDQIFHLLLTRFANLWLNH